MANTLVTIPGKTQISDSRYELSIDTAALVTVSDAAVVLDQVQIDNTANSTVVYLKIYDNDTSSSATLGATNPIYILPCPASSTTQYTFEPGQTLSLGMQCAIVTNAGTGGTSAPSSAVTAVILGH